MFVRNGFAHGLLGALLIAGMGPAVAYELKLNGIAPDGAGSIVIPGADYPAAGTGTGVLTSDAGPIRLSSEVAWADSGVVGVTGTEERRRQDFAFLIDANATATPPEAFAAASRYYIDLSLTGASFALAVADSLAAHIVSGESAVPLSGATITVVEPATDAPDGTGGAVGDNAVRLQLATTNSTAVGDLYLTLPIEVSNSICSTTAEASLSVSISSVTTPDAPNSMDVITPVTTTALTKVFANCGRAYGLRIASDTAFSGGNSGLVVPGFTGFVVGTAGPAVDLNGDGMGNGLAADVSLADTTARAAVGAYEVSFDPDDVGPMNANLAFVYSLADWQNDAFTGQASRLFVDGSVAQFIFLALEGTGLANVTVGVGADGVEGSFLPGAPGVIIRVPSTVIGGATINTTAFSNPVFVTYGSSSGAVETLLVTAELQFSGTTLGGYFPNNTLAIGEVSLDAIDFAAGYCGEFDWVSSNNNRFNMIRITGHGPNVSAVQATLRNVNVASGDTAPPETATWEMSEFAQISNGDAAQELIITSADLRASGKFGDFGEGDLSLLVMGADDTLDCDRLISAGASGLVTPFGNDRSASGDGDD